jgi:hypothetical protein
MRLPGLILARTLASPFCLGREPKVKVATLSLQVLPKSPMGYFEMNSNMAITFRVKVSYNFAISIHILTFTNYKFNLNFFNN